MILCVRMVGSRLWWRLGGRRLVVVEVFVTGWMQDLPGCKIWEIVLVAGCTFLMF